MAETGSDAIPRAVPEDAAGGPVGPAESVEATGVWRTFRESPIPVRAVLFGVFVNKLGGFLTVFLVLYLIHRGFSAVQASLGLGSYGAGSVLGVIVGGSLTDRLGPRRTIVAGMTGNAAFLIVMLYVTRYPALLLSAALVGALSQLYRPASAALLAGMIPQQRQVMIFAMYRLSLNLGGTVAPLIGAALVGISYRALFWGEASASLGYAVICLLALPREQPRRSPRGDQAAARRATAVGAVADPAEAAGGTSVPAKSAGYRIVFADRRYLAYMIAMLINCAVYVQLASTLPLSMRAAGLSTLWYGAVVALNGFVVICFELVMTKLTQHQSMSRILAVGFPLMGAGMALYAFPEGGVTIFLVGTLIWSVAEIVHGPSIFAYPGRGRPEHLRGRYVAAAHAMFGIGTAVGPVIGVALWTQIGRASWLVTAVVCVLALAPGLWGVAASGDRSLSSH